MKDFSCLIKNIVNIKEIKNFSIVFKDSSKERILQTIFDIFLQSEYSIEKKFEHYQTINNNIFLSSNAKNDFNTLFFHIQKTYHALNKFVFLYKYNKTKIVVDMDICLNKININEKNIICIFQNNGKYLFHALDLLKMFYISLTNSDTLFSNPIPLKNPYNNLPFTKSNLYNIYFFIKYKTDFYSDLYFKFFLSNFNLTLFYEKYEYILREYSIENYTKNTSINLLYLDTLSMLRSFNRNTTNYKIHIDKEFPKEKLVKIMKPYLLLYFINLYSLVKVNKEQAYFQMHIKLMEFSKFNPNFGKKNIYLEKENFLTKKKEAEKICFNDKHISFNKKENDFLKTHLKINIHNNLEYQLRQLELNYSNIIYQTNEVNNQYPDDDDDDDDDDIHDNDPQINDNISNIHNPNYNNPNYNNQNSNSINSLVTSIIGRAAARGALSGLDIENAFLPGQTADLTTSTSTYSTTYTSTATNSTTNQPFIFPSIPIVNDSTFTSSTRLSPIYQVNQSDYLFLDEEPDDLSMS
jgi:hypothetical protein